jgi:hypothetical protein
MPPPPLLHPGQLAVPPPENAGSAHERRLIMCEALALPIACSGLSIRSLVQSNGPIASRTRSLSQSYFRSVTIRAAVGTTQSAERATRLRTGLLRGHGTVLSRPTQQGRVSPPSTTEAIYSPGINLPFYI